MLTIGGYLNLLISLGHLAGLIWAWPFFKVTGIAREMKKMALIHPSLPYLITMFVSVIFALFGLYAFSADRRFRPLPYTRTAIFLIAGIYLLRGAAQVFTDVLIKEEGVVLGTIYSLIALVIGLLYLAGGLQKWVFGSRS